MASERPLSLVRSTHAPRSRISHLSNAKLMRALFDAPSTLDELVEETGLGRTTVKGYIKALRAEKLVRVCDRKLDSYGKRREFIYEWAPDKPDFKLKPLTAAECNRRYRERQRAKLLSAIVQTKEAA